MKFRAFLGAVLLVLAAAGCDCGNDGDRDHDRAGTEPTKTAEPEPEPEPEPPPPPAQPRQDSAPTGRPFGTASVTFDVAEGRPRAKVRITIPEGATVADGATLRAAIYFDNGPPIAALLTARGGAWETQTINLPAVVKTAERTILRISTTPEQTSFVWESLGAWQTAEQGPVTLDTGH